MLYVKLGLAKSRAFKVGGFDKRAAAHDDSVWPLQVRLINNNINNQLASPTLFFALALTLLVLSKADGVSSVMAIGYVASRCIHSVVHITSNRVSIRLPVFVVSLLILLAMTVRLFFQIW